ncbi:MAG: 16S rRNA (guanine(966)-N(2))-methyltransferase RsmD [Peptococcaceae bacterium]|nr:16S rRNA (guanine(966)-N(2))-methyltransferase RsmD [Peptococcaceae bacterium]
MLRIIGGTARGRRLAGPGAQQVRPTAERVREAYFNIVTPMVEGAVFLDLFAGTGCMGIEALSRGAREAHFVENHPEAVRLIRHNLGLAGFTGRVHRAEVMRWLAAGGHPACDLVFIDPPYGRGQAVAALAGISSLLAPEGLAVAETGRREEPPGRVGSLALTRLERYGDTILTFFAKED